MDIQETIKFINKKEAESEHFFQDWNITYLAKVLQEYADQQLSLVKVNVGMLEKKGL